MLLSDFIFDSVLFFLSYSLCNLLFVLVKSSSREIVCSSERRVSLCINRTCTNKASYGCCTRYCGRNITLPSNLHDFNGFKFGYLREALVSILSCLITALSILTLTFELNKFLCFRRCFYSEDRCCNHSGNSDSSKNLRTMPGNSLLCSFE